MSGNSNFEKPILTFEGEKHSVMRERNIIKKEIGIKILVTLREIVIVVVIVEAY